MLADSLHAGFADPVKDSQAVFRAILDALSMPGTVQELPSKAAQFDSMTGELVSTLLTLTGPETSIALSPSLMTASLRSFIGFHTGARLTGRLDEAAFLFVAEGDPLPEIGQCNLGSQEYPDRSTTIVLAVSSLKDGPKRVLRGPGIETTQEFAIADLPESFVGQWAENRELFPRGVDMLFVSSGKIVGLPRSTRMVEA